MSVPPRPLTRLLRQAASVEQQAVREGDEDLTPGRGRRGRRGARDHAQPRHADPHVQAVRLGVGVQSGGEGSAEPAVSGQVEELAGVGQWGKGGEGGQKESVVGSGPLWRRAGRAGGQARGQRARVQRLQVGGWVEGRVRVWCEQSRGPARLG
jgi:hypothetical protein